MHFKATAQLVRHSRSVCVRIVCCAIALGLSAQWFFVATGFAQEPSNAERHRARALPLTDFYSPPDPLPPATAGELIRSERFDDYDLPLEVSMIRILYHSRSARGQDVAASGVVLYPERKAPPGGWPLIAWAHDLTGVARSCAPSLTRNLGNGPVLSMYVHLGYAIVAADYTGLGTPFRNAFADMDSNARDVIYSIPAARKAVPQLGSRWVAMGMGDGGTTVLAVDELEHETHDPDYLGSVAFSPPSDLETRFASPARLPQDPLLLAYGIQTVYPAFSVKDVLSDKALEFYRQISSDCKPEGGNGYTAAEMVKPGWEQNSFVQAYLRRNRVGSRPAGAPLLILSANESGAVESVSRLCARGDTVESDVYPDSNSGMLIGDSVRGQIAWIEERFANKPARGNCGVPH